jgi:VanZ family protein
MSRSRLGLWAPFLGMLAIEFSLSSMSEVPGARYVWDKLLHTAGYAVIGLLALRAFNGGLVPLRVKPTIVAGVVVVLWGISDEFHQSFVPGRDASALDVVADAVGFAVAAGLAGLATLVAGRTAPPR